MTGKLTDALSEVAGRVHEIGAAIGDRLEAGDEILVLESMKMEIPLFAPVAGRLASILVTEGESVTEGQPLARIES